MVDKSLQKQATLRSRVPWKTDTNRLPTFLAAHPARKALKSTKLSNKGATTVAVVTGALVIALITRAAFSQPSQSAIVDSRLAYSPAYAVTQHLPIDIFEDSAALPKPANNFDRNFPPFLSTVPELPVGARHSVWSARAVAVTRAFARAWNAYERDAWGADELSPISKTGVSWLNVGLTMVDALDTAILMNNTVVVEKAQNWIAKFHPNDTARNEAAASAANLTSNQFEGASRALGALLGAYTLLKKDQSQDILRKTVYWGDLLVRGCADIEKLMPNDQGIATTSKLLIDLKYLSNITADSKYWKAAELINTRNQLLLQKYNTSAADVKLSLDYHSITLLFHETMVKQFFLTNRTQLDILTNFKTLFHNEIKPNLLMRTHPNNLFYIKNLTTGNQKIPTNDIFHHSGCAYPGVLALAATKSRAVPQKLADRRKIMGGKQLEELYIAEELARSCFELYHQSATGIAATSVRWRPSREQVLVGKELDRLWARFERRERRVVGGGRVRSNTILPVAHEDLRIIQEVDVEVDFEVGDHACSLEAEMAQTLFVLFRITGNEKYREWGWRIFRAYVQWSSLPSGGFTTLVSWTWRGSNNMIICESASC
ncbi:mannosyl-oligosaccharide alpha-1,2-mannosidase [Entophlyctis luteolus]|nr:mannosyl-oligosaccharide alpha-1,2-mannosidase [Entophlyctis luteolus]